MKREMKSPGVIAALVSHSNSCGLRSRNYIDDCSVADESFRSAT